MNAPMMNEPALAGAAPVFPSLESIELELSLQCQDVIQHGFEGSVRRALTAAGGTLMFHMRTDSISDSRWVAVASMRDGEERKLIVITVPAEGNTLRVEAVEESDHPLAGIAVAYANVMDRLSACH